MDKKYYTKGLYVMNAQHEDVARAYCTEEAEFIVTALNAHDKLVAALKAEQEWRAREADGALDPDWDYDTMVAAPRRAALTAAGAA